MRLTQEIKSIVQIIVLNYAKYCSSTDRYYLNQRSVPDFTLNELSAAIIKSDSDHANEALGSDNPWFESKMIPSLIEYLADETNKDKQIKFLETFRDSVTHYLRNQIDQLIEWGLEDFNQYRKQEKRQHKNPNYLQGAYA